MSRERTIVQAARTNRRQCIAAAATWLGSLGTAGLPALAQAGTGTGGLPQQALVVGNDRYLQNARLHNAVRDAELVGQTLAGLGAELTRVRDATSAQLREQVLALVRRAAAAHAVAWFYCAGHGVQMAGKNYLQGVDADFSHPDHVRAQGLDLAWITDMLSRENLPAAIVLVDACRDNPFVPATRGFDGHGLAPLEPQGLLVGYSTAPFKKALDGRQQANGPYASALAAVLGQRPVHLHEAMQRVAQRVYQATARQQAPWFTSSLRAGLLLEPQGARLVGADGAAAVAAGPGARPGSARGGGPAGSYAYRPDVPASAQRQMPATAAADHWQSHEDRLLADLYYARPEDARQWLAAARRPGASDDARLRAAMVLMDAKAGQPQDLAQAQRLLLPMARQGHVLAQTLLGEVHYERRQADEAYKWFALAAQSGYRRARMDLAELTFRSDFARDGQVNVNALKSLGRAWLMGAPDALMEGK